MTDQLEQLAREEDDTVPFIWAGQSYLMRKRIKRLKFLRLLNENPADALQLCFLSGEYERLEDLDLTADEMKELLTRVAEEFAGSAPNSGASPRA